MKIWQYLLVSSSLLTMTLSAAASDNYRFRVFLDDREIGYHNFNVSDEGKRVDIEAEFQVKFLFITAYRYRHLNQEVWDAGCVTRISSETDVNGRFYFVLGELSDNGLMVSRAKDETRQEALLPECSMTFAYWDPRLLEQNQLLNAQTGELTNIEVIEKIPETILVRGVREQVTRYRLKAGKLEIYLWYTRNQEWVGLMSDLNGRQLRYELI
jgi:hypothetical protein